MGKSVESAMEFEKTSVSKKVRPGVAVKEIERAIDNFGVGRILWYMTKRWKFQLSFLVNVVFVATPIIKFAHQFFQ